MNHVSGFNDAEVIAQGTVRQDRLRPDSGSGPMNVLRPQFRDEFPKCRDKGRFAE